MTKDIAHLLSFLDNSPTAWHATANCAKELLTHGFKELKEEELWQIKPGGRYFVTRNGSSLCAFVVPKKSPTSIRATASHTDSPAFKLKPNAEFQKENMTMLGLEIYGAPMLASWLNRDLGIAGRVVFTDNKGHLKEELVVMKEHPVVIPQLAIHLDRSVNDSGPVLNKQEHLAALVGLTGKRKNKDSFIERSLKKLIPLRELLGSDLFLYPLEKARLIGENSDMIASYRIDNLGSVHAGLQGLLQASQPGNHAINMAVFWDNEEIGSNTSQGASSPFLLHVVERITLALNLPREHFLRLFSTSLCLSVDFGHALHPNYTDKHEPRHLSLMNHGIVIKTNAQYRYASDARSTAEIIALCHQHKIPFQKYVSRGDIPCGTTVGPINAQITGMPTLDIGCPQLSMHSARELTGAEDYLSLCKLLTKFYHV